MPAPTSDPLRAQAENGNAEAQFQLSQTCLQNRDLAGMIHWLQRSSDNNFCFALDALGHCYEKGMGVTRNYETALRHYEKADRGGSGLAAYRSSELVYKSREGAGKKRLIRKGLQRAANAKMVPALRVIGYLAMQQPSHKDLAIQCFRAAARIGDPCSIFNLAWCLLQKGRDAQPEAVYWLQKAKMAQYPFVDALMAPLHGIAAALPANYSDAEIDLDESFLLHPVLDTAQCEDLHKDPAIKLFKNVLDIVDCAHLIFLSRPTLQPAAVIDPENHDGMKSDVRTNMSTHLPFDWVDFIGRYVELKIIAATGEDLATSEPMSILRYEPGQYYRPHFDFFNPNLPVSETLLQNGGQRTASAITYLAAPSAGGGTSFPKLGLEVPASTGSTLWFRNCSKDGEIDKRSLHAGNPVEQGEKWVVTKWFRQRPTEYLEF